jgi:CspA family cold shock protein
MAHSHLHQRRTIRGTVKWWDHHLGYGFLAPDAETGLGADILMRKAAIRPWPMATLAGVAVGCVITRTRHSKRWCIAQILACHLPPDTIPATVKWYNEQRGYGFLTSNAGDDIFLHARVKKHACIQKLEPGQILFARLVPGGAKPHLRALAVCMAQEASVEEVSHDA